MKSLILYGSPTKLSNAHKLVTSIHTKLALQPEYYVRADLVEGDCESALSKAKPLPGETLLNTVDVPETFACGCYRRNRSLCPHGNSDLA